MTFAAHIRDDGTVQTVTEHCRNTALRAADAVDCCGLYNTAYLAGLIHDCGKMTDLFNSYIHKAVNGEQTGKVIHTFSGVIFILERYHNTDAMAKLTAELIAYAAGAHHGLFDIFNDGNNGFEHRLFTDKASLKYAEAVESFLSECAGAEELDALFGKAKAEISAIYNSIINSGIRESNDVHFMLGVLCRILLSAVIAADRTDTADFMADRITPAASLPDWERLYGNITSKLGELRGKGKINEARRYFSEACAEAAARAPGIYTLDLPTGAGKTLCALRNAVAHAKIHKKRRVFFVVPLLSILEQNAAVIREYINDDSAVFEHHSNVVVPRDDKEQLDRYELLADSWSSPVTVTTLVALLQTMFSGKTQSIRRTCSLCDSVIVIDEVQSLPKKTIKMFNATVNFLSMFCGATVVLCSATQPEFSTVTPALRYAENREIVPYDAELFGVFKRTEVFDKTTPHGMSVEQAADFAAGLLNDVSSMLVICNTKGSAERIYKSLKPLCGGAGFMFVSASMCAAHRTERIKQIKQALKCKEKVVCVSTQVLEAGVDISFECVIRVLAGIDSIAQAAGRCNRGNEYGGIRNVYTLNLKNDCENLMQLREIATAQRCAGTVLSKLPPQPDGSCDALCAKSVSEYYRLLFSDSETVKLLDCPTGYGRLFELLGQNKTNLPHGRLPGYVIRQAFETAGDAFTVFDSPATDVIVPYGENGEKLIADICSQRALHDMGYLAGLADKAKFYTVALFGYQKDKLLQSGLLHSSHDGRFLYLDTLAYSEETGLEANPTLAY